MQSLRFTHIVCTSMKRGLAVVKAWIMTSYLFVGLRSIQRIMKNVFWQLPDMTFATS